MKGPVKSAGLFIAGVDRVAVDAAGVAVLKLIGSNRNIMERPVFGQEQIARAVELGLGVSGPGEMELVSDDQPGSEAVGHIRDVLRQG